MTLQGGSNRTVTNEFETINLNYTGTAAGVIEAVDFGGATALNVSTSEDLELTSVTTAADADVSAEGSSGDITATFTATIDSYTGGSGTDDITLNDDAALNADNTFDGGAGADDELSIVDLEVDAGIVNLSGFEILNIETADTAAAVDLRDSTDIETISLTGDDDADDLELTRIASGVTIEIADTVDELTTTTQSGTEQTVSFTAAATLDALTVDDGTETLNLVSDDGDGTDAETLGDLDAVTGATLDTIIVTGGDDLDLTDVSVASVTTFDASDSDGDVTYTSANATAATITGGDGADALTGGDGDDTITGGSGDDTLDGGAGDDTYVFSTTNGTDTITFVQADDVLDVSNLGSFTVEQNGALGTAINVFTSDATNDVDIDGKIVLLDDAEDDDDGDDNVDEASEITGLIDGNGDVFSIAAGGKGLVVAGNATLDGTTADDTLVHVFLVEDANGDGDVADSDEVQKIAVIENAGVATDFDLDTLTTDNFAVA